MWRCFPQRDSSRGQWRPMLCWRGMHSSVVGSSLRALVDTTARPTIGRSVDLTSAAAKFLELASRASEHMGEIVSSPELEERIDRLPTRLSEYGVDAFGFDPQ